MSHDRFSPSALEDDRARFKTARESQAIRDRLQAADDRAETMQERLARITESESETTN